MNLHDFNWKIWGLALALALGATVELMKRTPTAKSWDGGNLQAPKERPYANNRTAPAMIKPPAPAVLPAMRARPATPPPAKYVPPVMSKEQMQALVAQQNKPAGTTFEHGETKKKKADESEWEIVVDPKTGKRIKRRKKKAAAKKEEEKKEEPKKIAEEPVEEEQKSDSDSDIDNAITTSIVSGRLAPLPRPRADDAFNSAEEWIKRLLARPNLAETNRFVDHFRKNLVTPEVFYKVVNAMLDDSRPEMKKLGILAAANTPTYPMSFQTLAIASANPKHDATVRAKAEEALNAYTAFNRLGILEKILKGGATANATYVAAVKLEESAKKNLGTQAQGTNASTPAAVQQRATAYQRLVAPLTNLSRNSPDARVKQQATQTLATLQGLLGSSTTASQQLAQQPAQ